MAPHTGSWEEKRKIKWMSAGSWRRPRAVCLCVWGDAGVRGAKTHLAAASLPGQKPSGDQWTIKWSSKRVNGTDGCLKSAQILWGQVPYSLSHPFAAIDHFWKALNKQQNNFYFLALCRPQRKAQGPFHFCLFTYWIQSQRVWERQSSIHVIAFVLCPSGPRER